MSLNLDERQRAMLQEMHIPVWWPRPDAPSPSRATAVADEPVALAVQSPPPVVARVAPAAPVMRAPVRVEAGMQGVRASEIEAMDWTTLQTSVAGCQACKLCSTRKNTVFGVGPPAVADGVPPRADWMIVGEAPGENEDIRGEPFVGQAGKLLDNMLRAIGVDRQGATGDAARSAFITNVLKCRPPSNRNPEPDEVAQCEPYLRRQIDLLQPKVILGLGRFAVQSLLQGSVADVHTTPLGRLRGKVYTYHGVPVIVSYHPAYLLRSLPDKAKAWADLCLAKTVS